MLSRLRLLRNVGVFDSVSSGANIPLGRLTLIYAENGRGKTTLAAILRSLANGDPLPIAERRRLAAVNPPHVIVERDDGPPATFQDGEWNRTIPDMAVFDDTFIDQNVSSGLVVEPEHRQRLHDLILGAQAVELNRQLEQLVQQVEDHNFALRRKAEAILAAERGTHSVAEFCELPERADIDAAIQGAERNLAAARDQESVRHAQVFEMLTLPGFDVLEIEHVLQQGIASLDATAAAQVQAHLAKLGPGGEAWVAEGMRRVSESQSEAMRASCPFCAQGLERSPIIDHYRGYFSAAYADLKQAVSDTLSALLAGHGGDAQAAFERAVRLAGERQQFWSQFCDVPEVGLDTVVIGQDWRSAREGAVSALERKGQAPLEELSLASAAKDALAAYEGHRQLVAELNQRLEQANAAILVVKEQAAAGAIGPLMVDLAHLKAIKARHSPDMAALCASYLAEKEEKAETERHRNDVRGALDAHRATAFPAYQTAINLHLQRFSAGFRLESISPANIRGGATCTYDVLINNTPVPVAGGEPEPGEPSFRNTLSSGDRNVLALAFFFASLDQDPTLASKIVVIDDPISSLDEHRALTTVQEIRHLAEGAAQVIVLSHYKRFLCHIWRGADTATRRAFQAARDGEGSTLREWDVNEDAITEHDRQHALLREYLASSAPDERDVARAIRPVLEAFLRVAFPDHFPPGTFLGQFQHLCEQRVGSGEEILSADDTRQLKDLTEYANKFHHDTNQASETEQINDGELAGFVTRALAFARR